MTHVFRRASSVLLALALTLVPLCVTGSAFAEPAPYRGSVEGRYTGVAEHGHAVTMEGEPYTTTATFNVHLEESDQQLTTYCIDVRTGLVEDAWYREDQWENYPGQGDFAGHAPALAGGGYALGSFGRTRCGVQPGGHRCLGSCCCALQLLQPPQHHH